MVKLFEIKMFNECCFKNICWRLISYLYVLYEYEIDFDESAPLPETWGEHQTLSVQVSGTHVWQTLSVEVEQVGLGCIHYQKPDTN